MDPEIREIIGRLRQHGKTIDEIRDHLRSMEIDVSRSALGRHVQSLEKVSERMRRSRAIADALARQIGDTSESKLTSLNIELLHGFVFDFLASAEGDDDDAAGAKALLRDPMAMKLFSEAVERLTKASRHNADFVEQVEKRSETRTKAAAAKAMDTVAKEKGLSADTLAAIKAGIFGVKAG
jgi:DNA-binding transcriptional ArsR family regulator